MTIMSRLLRLCKADVHGVMDQLEDKRLLLKQYLREMETELDAKTRRTAALDGNLEQVRNQVVRHSDETARIEEDLEQALVRGRDDIARMLIRRRRSIAAAVRQMEAQVAAMEKEKNRLDEVLAHQRLQYETLKSRTEVYWRHGPDDVFDHAAAAFPAARPETDLSDEAVELELLRRKDALNKGETP